MGGRWSCCHCRNPFHELLHTAAPRGQNDAAQSPPPIAVPTPSCEPSHIDITSARGNVIPNTDPCTHSFLPLHSRGQRLAGGGTFSATVIPVHNSPIVLLSLMQFFDLTNIWILDGELSDFKPRFWNVKFLQRREHWKLCSTVTREWCTKPRKIIDS